MLNKVVKKYIFFVFSASLSPEGEVDLVHPQLSKLLKSFSYGYGHHF